METKTFKFDKPKFMRLMVIFPIFLIVFTVWCLFNDFFSPFSAIPMAVPTIALLYVCFFNKRIVELVFKEDRICYKLSFETYYHEILYSDIKTCEINFAPEFRFHLHNSEKPMKFHLGFYSKSNLAEIEQIIKKTFVIDERYKVHQKGL